MTAPGPIALLGSGEFLPVMRETDRHLIDRLGGPKSVRVAVIPTASGLEPGMPAKWAELGVGHFRDLGVQVDPILIVDRVGAHDPEWVDALKDRDLYYFSGGHPAHVIQSFRETPAWRVILARHLAGAGIAGCSAGAMLLGGATIHLREVARGAPATWIPALGVVPRLATIPHFDRVNRFIAPEIFERALAACPPDLTVLGIDEDTALVRLAAPGRATGPRWQVMGRQSVAIVTGPAAGRQVYAAGDEVRLDEGPAPSIDAARGENG